MGTFRKKKDEQCLLRLHASSDWRTVFAAYEGADFGVPFFPAAVLDAAVTTISSGRRQGLLNDARKIRDAYSQLNEGDGKPMAGLEVRQFPNLSAPYFNQRDWNTTDSFGDASIVVECELRSGHGRSGATTVFQPLQAATDDSMIDLYRTTWDWLVVRSGANVHDISIAEMVAGGVCLLHQQSIDSGVTVTALDRGKALDRALKGL